MKVLNADELLDVLHACHIKNRPMQAVIRDLERDLETLTDRIAALVRARLQVEIKPAKRDNAEMGGTACMIGPRFTGQEQPAELIPFDGSEDRTDPHTNWDD